MSDHWGSWHTGETLFLPLLSFGLAAAEPVEGSRDPQPWWAAGGEDALPISSPASPATDKPN